jgi:hypothetical protein
MKLRTVQAILFVLVLSLFAADFSLGCGHGYVYGPVTQKFRHGGDDGETFLIAVSGTPYEVPQAFWTRVELGDTVKYTGKQWQLVKTAKGETPAPSNAPAPGPTY